MEQKIGQLKIEDLVLLYAGMDDKTADSADDWNFLEVVVDVAIGEVEIELWVVEVSTIDIGTRVCVVDVSSDVDEAHFAERFLECGDDDETEVPNPNVVLVICWADKEVLLLSVTEWDTLPSWSA